MANTGFLRFNDTDITEVIAQETANKVNKTDMTEALKDKLDVSTYNSEKSSFALTSTLNAEVAKLQPKGDYATNTALSDGLANKLDSSQAETLYLGKTDKAESAKTADSVAGANVIGAVASATTATQDTNGDAFVSTYAKKSELPTDVLTKTEAGNVYATKTAVTQEIDTKVADYLPLAGGTVSGSITATSFVGNLTGVADSAKTATTATKATQDATGKDIAATYATKQEMAAQVASVMRYKGTVATAAELPTDAQIGDTYNVTADGANHAWNGTAWDKLSETIDLTPFLKSSDAAATYLTKTEASATYATSQEMTTSLAGKLGKTENAVSATKLATPQTIAIGGAVTGTATGFDGSAPVTINTTAVDGSKVTGAVAEATKATTDAQGNVIDTFYVSVTTYNTLLEQFNTLVTDVTTMKKTYATNANPKFTGTVTIG